jgi:hypothetical protein
MTQLVHDVRLKPNLALAPLFRHGFDGDRAERQRRGDRLEGGGIGGSPRRCFRTQQLSKWHPLALATV